MNYNDLTDAIGVALILLAYILNIVGWIPKNGKFFLMVNFFGAALACYASVLIAYTPFIILEGIWALVSAAAWLKLILQKEEKP